MQTDRFANSRSTLPLQILIEGSPRGAQTPYGRCSAIAALGLLIVAKKGSRKEVRAASPLGERPACGYER